MGSWFSQQPDLDSIGFELKLQSKQLEREAVRSDKEQKIEESKAKRNLEKGLIDNARINAENSIRKKNEALNYRRLAGKVEAISSRISAAQRTDQIMQQFSNVMPRMQNVLKTLSPENISKTMSDFEQVFEDLDVIGAHMNVALNSATAVSTPISEVDSLLTRIADEHNIQVQEEMGELPIGMRRKDAASEQDLKSRYENLK